MLNQIFILSKYIILEIYIPLLFLGGIYLQFIITNLIII